jgi:hypothetical protein
MKLILHKSSQAVPGAKLLRLAGYIYIVDRKYGKDSYSHPLGRYHYPRFHCYPTETASSLILDLHLDQKQAIYVGVKRHSGEYDGPAVEGELARLQVLAQASGYIFDRQKVVERVQPNPVRQQAPSVQPMGTGDYRQTAQKHQVKKSWWMKLFT